jgi:ATP-binding cassette, subfamily B, bacterial
LKLNFFIKAIRFVYLHSKTEFIKLIILMVIQSLLPLFTIMVTNSLINSIEDYVSIGMSNISTIIILLILQLGLLTVSSSVHNYKIILDTKLSQNLDFFIKESLIIKSVQIKYSNFENPRFYNDFQRAQAGTSNKFLLPINNLLEIIKNCITLVSILGFIFHFHWFLGIISFLSGIPIFAIQIKFGIKRFNLMKHQTPTARQHSYVFSLFSNRVANKELRIFGISKYLLDKWKKLFNKNKNEIIKLVTKQQQTNILVELCTSLLYTGSLFFLLHLVTKKIVRIGDFVAIGESIRKSQTSINIIAMNLGKLYENSLFLEDFFRFFESEEETEIERVTGIEFPHKLESGIQINNLSYRYPQSRNDSLKNINLKINPGEKIAILGENGSGKSTLIKCLLGLYEVERGSILFDGIPIDYINSQSLHKNISVIFQDFIKYEFSVRENIGFGNLNKINAEEDLIFYAKLTGSHSFINKLGKTYSTNLGKLFEESEDLSGGQWQKIALTRALIKDPQVLILDEPTSALDPISEYELYKKFLCLSLDKTLIFITHRMYPTLLADKIILLRNGEILEAGSPQKLLQQRGEYYKMYAIQAEAKDTITT